jgi:hypothetical protein
MKEKVIKIMLGWVENNEPIETTADKLLDLFAVSGSLPCSCENQKLGQIKCDNTCVDSGEHD